MNVVTQPISRAVLVVCSVVTLLAVAVSPARAGSPLWDHYKVYGVTPHPSSGAAVGLRDQFQITTHTVETLDWFMNPTEKITSSGAHFGVSDPTLHYSWWRITPSPFSGLVSITNQFGPQQLLVHDALYLLNPALKNQAGILIPERNHYKCYLCDGQPVDQVVTMIDQFGTWQATVLAPKYFCNPVEKTVSHAGAQVTYPIVDPLQHYTCYEFQPPDPIPHDAFITDQFLSQFAIIMYPGQYTCVPTDKDRVVPTKQNTWGRLKLMYR